MKFKDLPEGFYQITQKNELANKVFVELFENPDNLPLGMFVPAPIQVVQDGRSYNGKHHMIPKNLDNMDVEFKTFAEVRDERKAYSARISHVTRKINLKEPLKGKTLELALNLVRCDDPDAGINHDLLFMEIARKFEAGEALTEYEQHMMVDVHLVHARF